MSLGIFEAASSLIHHQHEGCVKLADQTMNIGEAP